MSIFALKSRVGIDLVCTVSYDAVRRLVGLPRGHMDAWDAKFGRIWPLEPGVRATLSPAHTHLKADFFTWRLVLSSKSHRLLQPPTWH